MHAPSIQAIILRATASYLAVLALSEASLAQDNLADRSTGPTLGGFFNDISIWGTNHPGAAIALSAAVLLAIGMAVYSRFTSKGP